LQSRVNLDATNYFLGTRSEQMPIINDPKTGDALLDLLITSGVSEGVLKQLSTQVQRFNRSLTREEMRARIKQSRAIIRRL